MALWMHCALVVALSHSAGFCILCLRRLVYCGSGSDKNAFLAASMMSSAHSRAKSRATPPLACSLEYAHQPLGLPRPYRFAETETESNCYSKST